MMPALVVIIGCLLALNVWLTRRVLRAPDEHLDKKGMLVAGIWIVPLVGAWIAWEQLRTREPSAARTREEAAWAQALATREPAPDHVPGADGAAFALQAHMAGANGFPWLDWAAVDAWARSMQPARPENRRLVTEQCRRAWLLHLRDALGPDFLLHESDHALILSSLEPQVARATASFVAKTRQRIARLLGALAHLPPEQKSVLVVFDDQDSYYRYVGALYPDEGEFAFSGGMFIDAGCPHFVTQRADLAQIEPVIAHELTHSAIAHLALPLWLDEGIAVNTEHKLTGLPRNLHTPQQMHAKHLQFWGEAEIQQFWAGDSFHRPDDGQMLSYDLARVLVEKLACDWSGFERFASHAAREDAGAQAASEQLGVDLGAWVCTLLERPPSDGWAPAVQSAPSTLPVGAPDRPVHPPVPLAHRGMKSTDDGLQPARVRKKLALASACDPEFKVFGAQGHRYALHPPASEDAVHAFESRHAITLPDAYRRFLLTVGNGGVGHGGSGAGPFYGIYALGGGVDDIPADKPETVLAKPCLLSPSMAKPDWAALIARLGLDSDLPDAAYGEAMGTLFGGLLPIGSQGCTYLHALVLNGPFTGRVVNLDTDHSQPPAFAYEPDFLAWYERWLDEVIAGDLRESPSWFGYVRGGPEEQLLAGARSAPDAQTKQEFLSGLLAKRRLSPTSLDELMRLPADTAEQRSTLCWAVCKSDHAKARPLLSKLQRMDPLAFLQCLHWYARDKIAEWKDDILALPARIEDAETFRFFTYVLEQLPVDPAPSLLPFVRSTDSEIRTQALHVLGKSKHRHHHLDCFIEGLHDPDNHVVRTTLQALAGLKHRSLLPHYRTLAMRFPEEQDYVLCNLDHRLKELGISRERLLQRGV